MTPQLPLLPTLAAAAVVWTLLSAALSWLLVRRETGAPGRRTVEERGGVACPDCGAENEPGYRYCRACVSQLPGEVALRRHETPPSRRLIR